MKLLNVGGNDKRIALPPDFSEFEHWLLDIDPKAKPDVLCDAREMTEHLDEGQFEVVFCSHNLEHYYYHDVPRVLKSFLHVLKDGGMLFARVPDMLAVMQAVVEQKLDIEDKLYDSQVGPIRVVDVMYGWAKEIELSGVDFFTHKTGFSSKSLSDKVLQAGFEHCYVGTGGFDVLLWAFKGKPNPDLFSKVPLLS